ncbi:MAG: FKBP-type peptidyl-prolyl cis-trans isomerase, partial [Gammaproteobacteria bacterium]|nr:FKBP-type peptidyl-prolyl cis-trans isomerase [Gammaproteobacteria bacterium]
MRFSPRTASHLLTGTLLGLALVSGSVSAQTEGLTTTKQKVSYGLGIQIARQLASQGLTDIDRDAFTRGIEDAVAGNDLAVSPEELQAAFQAFKQEVEQARASQGKDAMDRGQAFLAENKTAEGVKELEGGVQYKVLTEGDGPKPSASDQVEVHYKGMLLDGTEFD